MSDQHRFRVHFVDVDARLFVYVASHWFFVEASMIRDLLREERGGDWIILDGWADRVVADTRPGWPDVAAAGARAEAEAAVASLAPTPKAKPATGPARAPQRASKRRSVEVIPD